MIELSIHADNEYIGGRTLRDATEQAALLKLLRQIEAGTAWPVSRGIRMLEEDWEAQIAHQPSVVSGRAIQ